MIMHDHKCILTNRSLFDTYRCDKDYVQSLIDYRFTTSMRNVHVLLMCRLKQTGLY